MPNGGGGVFVLPPEYFGATGLGQSLGQVGQILSGYGQKVEARRDKKTQELLQQLQVAEQVFGKGSPQYAAIAQQITHDSTAQPLVPLQEQQVRAVNSAQARIAAGTATPDDVTLVNEAMYNDPLGLPGMRERATGEQRLRKLNVQSAEQTASDEAERRKILQAQGHTPGELQASLDINKVVAASEEVSNLRARTALTREQANTERTQQQVLRAQAAHYAAEARAAAAGSNGAFSRQDASYLAGLRVRLEQSGIAVPSTEYLAAGLQGGLPGTQQQQFNAAYGQYVTEQRQQWEATLARARAGDPNSTQAVAARNLEAYYRAQRNHVNVNVPEEQLMRWQAAVTGATLTKQDRTWPFRDRWVLNWTPGSGQGPVEPRQQQRTGPVFDEAQVRTAVERLVQQNGAARAGEIIRQQRESLNRVNPGSGDALLSAYNVLHPQTRATNDTVRNNTTAPPRRARPPSARVP